MTIPGLKPTSAEVRISLTVLLWSSNITTLKLCLRLNRPFGNQIGQSQAEIVG